MAISRGDTVAIQKLFSQLYPYLRAIAARSGVQFEQRDELVTTLLDDVVRRAIQDHKVPRNWRTYLAAATRNRARRFYRDKSLRSKRYETAAREVNVQGAILSLHSEYGLKNATSLGETAAEPHNAITRFGSWCMERLELRDRLLLEAVGGYHALVAREMGIEKGTLRVRLHRLRNRLVNSVQIYLDALEPIERTEVQRFLKRAGFRGPNFGPCETEQTPLVSM